MAETVDRRSEGKNSKTVGAKRARLLAKEREAAGVCKACGTVPVLNRKICIKCSDDASEYTKWWGFRDRCKVLGVDLVDTVSLLEDLHDGSEEVDNLIALFTLAMTKKQLEEI